MRGDYAPRGSTYTQMTSSKLSINRTPQCAATAAIAAAFRDEKRIVSRCGPETTGPHNGDKQRASDGVHCAPWTRKGWNVHYFRRKKQNNRGGPTQWVLDGRSNCTRTRTNL